MIVYDKRVHGWQRKRHKNECFTGYKNDDWLRSVHDDLPWICKLVKEKPNIKDMLASRFFSLFKFWEKAPCIFFGRQRRIFQLFTFLLSSLRTCFLIVVNVNAHTSLVVLEFYWALRWPSTGLCLIPLLVLSTFYFHHHYP